MPISEIDNCPASHWEDVLKIVTDTLTDAGYVVRLVSDSDESRVIHANIVENLYDNAVVVCDVSAKNPNVMFELGMRLAFDKPTVIIKDDMTKYTFDVGILQHLPYPRSLRYQQMVKFKKELVEKVKATHDKATSDVNYSMFLKHFKVKTLESQPLPPDKFILSQLKEMNDSINRLSQRISVSQVGPSDYSKPASFIGPAVVGHPNYTTIPANAWSQPDTPLAMRTASSAGQMGGGYFTVAQPILPQNNQG